MKQQQYYLSIFIIVLSLFSIIYSSSKLKSESKLLWDNVINNFLSAPGSSPRSYAFKMKDPVEDLVNIDEVKDKVMSKLERTTNDASGSTYNEEQFKLISNYDSTNEEKINYINEKDSVIQNEGWLTISSLAFKDAKKFPDLPLPNGLHTKIKIDKLNTRLNDKYDSKNLKGNNPPGANFFWFRLSGKYLYYSALKPDLNILGSIFINRMENIEKFKDKEKLQNYCLKIVDDTEISWILCAQNSTEQIKWICYLQASIGIRELSDCKNPAKYKDIDARIEVQKLIQPVIIIPQPSKYCNQQWDYKDHGTDWECKCKDGMEQSPIDLPPTQLAILSPVRPLFQYENVNPIATDDSPLRIYKAGENIKILHHKHSLRIFHNNFGKIVTVNGTGYQAQEIVFKTPSEHTINGQRYEMEMQVIHLARSKGDFGKKAILSFLFKAKPGVYNKFIDKLEFFNLPNPIDRVKDIKQNLFIPHVLYESDDEDSFVPPQFSFYTYQGSISEPPCTENTIIYIASKPINLSITALQLFKEALNIPDQEDINGNVITSDNSGQDNYRNTQPINGRPIFHYDSDKYSCPEFKPKKKHNINRYTLDPSQGHYEKKEKIISEYIFVNGNHPSGMSNSFVVPENEAENNDA